MTTQPIKRATPEGEKAKTTSRGHEYIKDGEGKLWLVQWVAAEFENNRKVGEHRFYSEAELIYFMYQIGALKYA